jgi:hypothetical protein
MYHIPRNRLCCSPETQNKKVIRDTQSVMTLVQIRQSQASPNSPDVNIHEKGEKNSRVQTLQAYVLC